MPYIGKLNKHAYTKTIDTIRQCENGTSDICEHNNQAQNQEAIVTTGSRQRIRKPHRLCHY